MAKAENSEYPHDKLCSFSKKAWKSMEKAASVSGRQLMPLIREWSEYGAKRTISEARKKEEK